MTRTYKKISDKPSLGDYVFVIKENNWEIQETVNGYVIDNANCIDEKVRSVMQKVVRLLIEQRNHIEDLEEDY